MRRRAKAAEDLFRRLRNRFNGDGWILLEEVGDGAGYHNAGWADAIAMQTWPSKGLTICGFEVKSGRPDWRKELNKPAKNRVWQGVVDEWYVVAPAGVVPLDELPAAWGLMVPQGKDGLQILSRCEKPPAPPEAVDRDLLAAVFRAAAAERKALRGRVRNRIEQKIREQLGEQIGQAKAERDRADARWSELADALGNRWDSLEELTAVAEAIKCCDRERYARRANDMATELEGAAKRLRDAQEVLTQLAKPATEAS